MIGKKYACVVADPPWAYENRALPRRGTKLNSDGVARRTTQTASAANRVYPTMPTEDICALEVPAADAAHLYLWVTNSHLIGGDGFRVCRAWGFEPKQLITWVKTGGSLGLGNYFRNCTEHVVFATRGSLPVMRRNMQNILHSPRGEHSEKPDGLLWMAEQMTPGPRLEMFARRRRDGWDVWGNEAPEASQMVVGL